MVERIKELYNRLRKRKESFKCIAYILDNEGGDSKVESFQLLEFSARAAYNTAFDLLKFKYPGKGLDIRIHKH